MYSTVYRVLISVLCFCHHLWVCARPILITEGFSTLLTIPENKKTAGEIPPSRLYNPIYTARPDLLRCSMTSILRPSKPLAAPADMIELFQAVQPVHRPDIVANVGIVALFHDVLAQRL